MGEEEWILDYLEITTQIPRTKDHNRNDGKTIVSNLRLDDFIMAAR